MDPATTSAGKPAETAGTVPAQFARVKTGDDGAVLEGGTEVGGTSSGVRSETPAQTSTTTTGEMTVESSS